MKVIEKIQVRFFRSIKDQTIFKLSDLNIFSGSNDSGKSNVLKALNLFFNNQTDFQKNLDFFDDFSKERLEEARKESIKARQFIAVKVHFIAPVGHKNLPKKFFVEKTWDREGHLLNTTENVLAQFKRNKTRAKTEKTAKQSLSRFINSIHYEYIPAVRSVKIFENLLNLLEDLIIVKQTKNSTINELLLGINDESRDFTKQISDDFERIAGIKSSIKVPAELKFFFKAFFINTETGQFSIPLRLRGDGIQMRYIPTILDYIAKNSRGIFIWGFDEPENSTEYSLCAKMAGDFLKVFSKKSQIFISTHSFHFTMLEGENLSKYRVYKDINGISSKISLIKGEEINLFEESDSQKINEELGILSLHKKIESEYREWQKNKDQWLDEFKKIKDRIEKNKNAAILFVEGKTDKKIIETAWNKLNKDQSMPFVVVDAFDRFFIGNMFARGEIFKNYESRVFIGMLDFDDGYDNWRRLKEGSNNYTEIIGRNKKDGLIVKHGEEKGYVFLLPVPDIRKEYADTAFSKSYLSIELLFGDNLLSNFITKVGVAGGGNIFRIKDKKKTDFADGVGNYSEKDFENFKQIFSMIDEILKEKI